MQIKQRLLPDGKPNKPNKPQVPQWITIHNTDNPKPDATAEAHSRYVLNGSCGRQASWHYSVDDKEIYQHLRDDEQGWHAGDGCGAGNTSSIGIEVCMYEGMDVDCCWRHAAKLVAHLLDKHKLTIDRVVPHKKWSGKQCPSQLLPHWDAFIGMVRRKTVNIAVYGKDICEGVFTDGCIMAPVRPVGEALGVKVGWNGQCPTVNGVKVAGSKVIDGASHAPIREILDACKPRISIGDKMRELNIMK